VTVVRIAYRIVHIHMHMHMLMLMLMLMVVIDISQSEPCVVMVRACPCHQKRGSKK
jgi:hypothetical protein